MKIAVLAGGLSPERNVSLSSGLMICETLRQKGHQAVLIDLFFGLEEYEGAVDIIFEQMPRLTGKKQIAVEEPDLAQIKGSRRLPGNGLFGHQVLNVCAMADIVFLALHGASGEDGRVQATFDLLGIPYTGSGYLGSAIAMDKDLTKQLMAVNGIQTPPWRTIHLATADLEQLASVTTFPCVVKPLRSGSSIGVSIVRSKEELQISLSDGARHGDQMIVERHIKGRELSVGVLEDQSLPPIEIIPRKGFYDYTNKYQKGAAVEVCPAEISQDVAKTLGKTALKLHRLLDLGVYSRTDFLLDETGGIWCLEINTLPGMTPLSLLPQEAAQVGLSYAALCERIITASLELRSKTGV